MNSFLFQFDRNISNASLDLCARVNGHLTCKMCLIGLISFIPCVHSLHKL